MENVVITNPVHKEVNEVFTSYKYAGFWVRCMAGFIDNIIAYLITIFIVPIAVSTIIPFIFVLIKDYIPHDKNLYMMIGGTIGFIIGAVIGSIYPVVLLITKWQATIGMKLFGIIVIDVHGNKISFMRSSLRCVVLLLIWYFSIFLMNNFNFYN